MANLERLRQLRRVIEEAPEARFHMTAFSVDTSCGTAYCAAGWAALDGWFQRNTPIDQILEVTEEGRVFVCGEEGTRFGLADIFGIRDYDAEKLFMLNTGWAGPRSVTKAEVLANIDRLIAGDDALEYAAVSMDDWDRDTAP